MHSYTTYYHSAPEPPLTEPILLVDGDRREIVANTVVLSNAAPTYAPAGRHLVATSVVGATAPPEPTVRAELTRLYGRSTADWTHLTTVAVPNALPAAPPPQGRLRKPVALGRGCSWPVTTGTAHRSRAPSPAAGAPPEPCWTSCGRRRPAENDRKSGTPPP